MCGAHPDISLALSKRSLSTATCTCIFPAISCGKQVSSHCRNENTEALEKQNDLFIISQ